VSPIPCISLLSTSTRDIGAYRSDWRLRLPHFFLLAVTHLLSISLSGCGPSLLLSLRTIRSNLTSITDTSGILVKLHVPTKSNTSSSNRKSSSVRRVYTRVCRRSERYVLITVNFVPSLPFITSVVLISLSLRLKHAYSLILDSGTSQANYGPAACSTRHTVFSFPPQTSARLCGYSDGIHPRSPWDSSCVVRVHICALLLDACR